MKTQDTSECEVHTLVCTNEKPEGKACCKRVGGQEFYMRMKEKLKANPELYKSHWITRTGCLGYCNNVGPTVAIHRNGEPPVFYSEINPETEFDFIWDEMTRKK